MKVKVYREENEPSKEYTIGGLENVKNMVRLYLEDLRYTKGVLSVVITNIMQDLSLTMLYHSPKEKIKVLT